MTKKKAEQEDFSAQLPNGRMFAFWETGQKYDREIHVDNGNPRASDQNDGTISQPFKTINAAAQVATPGTRVLIHAGTYRETVQPAMGGLGPEKMISYEAYQGEEVIIKASVEVKDCKPSVGWRLFPGFRAAPPSSEGIRDHAGRMEKEGYVFHEKPRASRLPSVSLR